MTGLRSDVLELFAEMQWLGHEYAALNMPPVERRRRRAWTPKPVRPHARVGCPPRPVGFKLTPKAEVYCALGSR